nr:nickel insertion protein [uncultured Anaerococcus sp.]
MLGHVLEKIIDIALDCYYSPIFMKKNRPAYKLSVIYKDDDEEKIEDIIFTETTSIGIRKFDLERTILDRKIVKISYNNKDYLAKQVTYKDKIYTYPEYESAKILAENEGISLKEAYDLMKVLLNEVEI